MGSPNTFRDAFGRGSAPVQGLGAARPDHFKPQRDQLPKKADAFAGTGKAAPSSGFYNPFAAPARSRQAAPSAETPLPVKIDPPKPQPKIEPAIADAPAAALPPAPETEAKTPSVKAKTSTGIKVRPFTVVASAPLPELKQARPLDLRRDRAAGKSSSLVLVSTTPLVTAMADEPKPASPGGGDGGVDAPVLDRPKTDPKPSPRPKAEKPAPKPKVEKTGGGGSGGGSGGSGGGPGGSGGGAKPAALKIPDHKDRVLNQDDLMGVAIVIALLLLLAMYLFRGGPAQAPAVSPIVSTQFAAAPPPPPVVTPPPDPFGDKPVDLTPKSAPPPEAAAAPPPAIKAPPDLEMHAFFCTAKSDLTAVSRKALEKQIKEYASYFSGKELIVTGYADTRGAIDYNNVLGGMRASTVAEFLKSRNLKIVETTGIGELSGLEDNQNCSNQRRVDISVAGETAEPPSRDCTPPKDEEELACG
ncbi:MAG TPA: hypothetical protein VG942_10330 [Hyphomonadaceae bacterium]|nr:hypothetical protein [Hyphomonadaceae bacterium]